jgi:hypothetical protein
VRERVRTASDPVPALVPAQASPGRIALPAGQVRTVLPAPERVHTASDPARAPGRIAHPVSHNNRRRMWYRYR